jgi:hypothetical protein
MIEIDAENKEINQLIDKDMCKIESIRNFKHNIYIKYYYMLAKSYPEKRMFLNY